MSGKTLLSLTCIKKAFCSERIQRALLKQLRHKDVWRQSVLTSRWICRGGNDQEFPPLSHRHGGSCIRVHYLRLIKVNTANVDQCSWGMIKKNVQDRRLQTNINGTEDYNWGAIRVETNGADRADHSGAGWIITSHKWCYRHIMYRAQNRCHSENRETKTEVFHLQLKFVAYAKLWVNTKTCILSALMLQGLRSQLTCQMWRTHCRNKCYRH